MNKKNMLVGIVALGLTWGTSFASNMGIMSDRYELSPGETINIKGNLLSTKKIACQVRSDSNQNNKLDFVSLHNQNIVNSFVLPEGNATSVNVKLSDILFLEFDHNSELQITNSGNNLINFECNNI